MGDAYVHLQQGRELELRIERLGKGPRVRPEEERTVRTVGGAGKRPNLEEHAASSTLVATQIPSGCKQVDELSGLQSSSSDIRCCAQVRSRQGARSSRPRKR